MKLLNIGMALFMLSVTQSVSAAPERASATDEPPRLELTSFHLTNPSPDRTAELCGRVQAFVWDGSTVPSQSFAVEAQAR